MKQSWQDFALAEPELSAFGEARLKSGSPAKKNKNRVRFEH